MDYTQVTKDQQDHMLATVGVDSIDRLFEVIPEPIRFKGQLDLPQAASELELQQELTHLASQNHTAQDRACFMGAGAYDHFIPAFIDPMISRGEFLTAYTPYQAEASQGSLQAFFEFQTQIARLTGMDLANASMYEGATAAAEAVLLAVNHTSKRRVLVAETIHPDTLAVLKTYTEDLAVDLIMIPQPAKGAGRLNPDTVRELVDDDTACIIVQSPNIFGIIEPIKDLFHAAKEPDPSQTKRPGKQPIAISIFNPISLGLLRSPGECGADIAVGEGQPLGSPLQFGGPYLGLFAAKKAFARKMPGRLVGMTHDKDGRAAFCLTLQTREQHIRGAKATSNICTNQGLFALRATMYMTAMGPEGLQEVAELCTHKAHYLADQIAQLPGFSLAHPDAPFFNEFAVRCPFPASQLLDLAAEQGFLAGVALNNPRLGSVGCDHGLLIAVTEKRTRQEMDQLVQVFAQITQKTGGSNA